MPLGTENMLRLENLSKVYRVGTFGGKELRAVSDVSFEIKEGEVTALIGESGSGKSTIGKMILRLTPRTSGAISFKGKDVSALEGNDLKEYYRHVQGVFQDPFSSYNPIFKADRVFRLVRNEFFPQIGDDEWKEKVIRSVRAVGLNPEQVLEKYPHQLSGGQLQRMLIARALLLDVQFLVADEIISMLDASTRIDVLNLLADLKLHGLSILFITHDLSLGYYISERAVILHRGYVVEMGATERIFAAPLHPYTQSLMASVPRLDMKWQDVRVGAEALGYKLGPPPGWTYFDSGSIATQEERLTGAEPMLLEVEPSHFVACVTTPRSSRPSLQAAGQPAGSQP